MCFRFSRAVPITPALHSAIQMGPKQLEILMPLNNLHKLVIKCFCFFQHKLAPKLLMSNMVILVLVLSRKQITSYLYKIARKTAFRQGVQS